MPSRNAFRHQRHCDDPPAAPFRVLTAPRPPAVDSEEFARRLRDVGRVLRQAGVSSIILMHGTFVGDDYFDLALMVERVSPGFANWLRRVGKGQPDVMLGDGGNYTAKYAQRMAEGINEPGEKPIDVRRFLWSGGNSHLPRTMAGIRLIDEIATLPVPGPFMPLLDRRLDTSTSGDGSQDVGQAVPQRVLCFAHSHGANAMAVATNLLGGSGAQRRRLLDIVRDVPGRSRGGAWFEAWRRACARLDSDASASELLGGRKLDLVTLGIPIRYGWDSDGYDHLLHMVNHRPLPGLPPWRGKLPQSLNELFDGRYGDWVQQLGIAGTNFPLLALRWGRWQAERKLGALLQQGETSWQVRRRIRNGQRVSDEGTTLLIDYGSPKRGRRVRHLFGHGMYTQTEWMPFHLEQAAAEFYSEAAT